MSESVFPVTTRGPRLTYVRSARSSIKTFAVVSGGMSMWHKPEPTPIARRRPGAARYLRPGCKVQPKERPSRAKPQPLKVVRVLPETRGTLKRIAVEAGSAPRYEKYVVAMCMGEHCDINTEEKRTVRMPMDAWCASRARGRTQCRTCACSEQQIVKRAMRKAAVLA